MEKNTEDINRMNEPLVSYSSLLHVFRQSPVAIGIYGKDGTLRDVNQAFLDLFGINSKEEEVKNINLFEDFYFPEQDILDIKAGKSVRSEFMFDFELAKSKQFCQTTKTGTCYLECYLNQMTNDSNEITGYLVNMTDLSRLKSEEIRIHTENEQLKKINAGKDKFLSILAHDLKNPFNAINGFTELMLKNYYLLDDETFQKGLKTIESASSHAYKLLENLLIWSQNQTGRREFKPEKLNLKEHVSESLNIFENSLLQKEISIVIRINKTHSVFADKNMVHSILRNLISNAIKFSHKGGKIKITATRLEDKIQISVSDQGVGISSGRIAAIFEIDKRSNTLGTNNEQGTGLGLILCKDFATRHGGTICIESTPGKGSIFTFSLPVNELRFNN